MFEETFETKSNAREPTTFAGKMLKYIHCDPRHCSSDIEEDSEDSHLRTNGFPHDGGYSREVKYT